MSYGYGNQGRANPYDQRGDAQQYNQPAYGGAPTSPQYGSQQYGGAQSMGRDEFAGQNVEMASLTQNGSQFSGQQGADPNAILNACREINQDIAEIEAHMKNIQLLQGSVLNNPDANSSANRQLEDAGAEMMAMFRNATARVKGVKQKPESGSPKNSAQVGAVDRKLKATIRNYQTVDNEFSHKLRDQTARQFRIARPDATEEEVQQAVEDPNTQVFAQAMMQSDRRGQAQSVLSSVKQRNEAIKKIERQMIELAELFNDMDNLVMQQEAAVVNIEMKGEEVVENMDKGNEQIVTAIQSAKNTRKWKWWCLGITLLVIAIIVIVILIYKFVIQDNGSSTNKATTKRFVLDDIVSSAKLLTSRRVVPGTHSVQGRAVVPGAAWSPDSGVAARGIVEGGGKWLPPSMKAKRFEA